MRIFIYLSLTFFLQSLTALEVVTIRDGDHTRHHIHRAENGKWIIDTIDIGPSGWPELLSSDVFDNRMLADQRMIPLRAIPSAAVSNGLPKPRYELRSPVAAEIWRATETWSWAWEEKYAEWIRQDVNKDFFVKYQIKTDCADVAVALRWIFARIHKLPMVNRTSSGPWFSHRSMKPAWASLPTHQEWHKDRRFRAALDYLLDHVFTHSLWADSYPIAINPQSLLPGVHHLGLADTSGHTQLVSRVGTGPADVPIVTLNSTVPREVRELMEFIFMVPMADPSNSALQRIRWPKFSGGSAGLEDKGNMPFYSEEQFASGFVQSPRTQFWQEVFERLIPGFQFDGVAVKLAQDLGALFQQRVTIVEDGWAVCKTGVCREGTPEWEAWSTPHRDQRISDMIATLQLIESMVRGLPALEQLMNQVVLQHEGFDLSLRQLIWVWNAKMFSSDPALEPRRRWGIHPEAASLNVAEKTRALLLEREASDQARRRCKDSSCVLGSPEYLAESASSIDQRLQTLSSQQQVYCVQLPSACQAFTGILQQLRARAHGEELTVSAWLERAGRWVSDPRAPDERRWLGEGVPFERFALPHGYFSDFPAVDRILIKAPLAANPRVILHQSGQMLEWKPPSGVVPVALDPQNGRLLIQEGGAATVMDPATGTRLGTLPLKSGGGNLTGGLLRGQVALFYDEAYVYHATLDTSGMHETRSWPYDSVYVSSHVLVFEGGGHLTVIDPTDGHFTQVPATTPFSAYYYARSGDDFVVEGNDLAVWRKNGTTVSLANSASIVFADLAGREFLLYKFGVGVYRNKYDENWNETNSVHVGSLASYGQNAIGIQKNGRLEFYTLDGGRLSTLPPLPAGQVYAGAGPDHLLVLESGIIRALKRASGRVVLKAHASYAHYINPIHDGSKVVFNLGTESALIDLTDPAPTALLTGRGLYPAMINPWSKSNILGHSTNLIWLAPK